MGRNEGNRVTNRPKRRGGTGSMGALAAFKSLVSRQLNYGASLSRRDKDFRPRIALR